MVLNREINTVPLFSDEERQSSQKEAVHYLLLHRWYIQYAFSDWMEAIFNAHNRTQHLDLKNLGQSLVEDALSSENSQMALRIATYIPRDTSTTIDMQSETLYHIATHAFDHGETHIAFDTLQYMHDEHFREQTLLYPFRHHLQIHEDPCLALQESQQILEKLSVPLENPRRFIPQAYAVILEYCHAYISQHPHDSDQVKKEQKELQTAFLSSIAHLPDKAIVSFARDLAESPDIVVRDWIRNFAQHLNTQEKHLDTALVIARQLHATHKLSVSSSDEKNTDLEFLEASLITVENIFRSHPRKKTNTTIAPILLTTLLYRALMIQEKTRSKKVLVMTDTLQAHMLSPKQDVFFQRFIDICELTAQRSITLGEFHKKQLHTNMIAVAATLIVQGGNVKTIDRLKHAERLLFPESFRQKESNPLGNLSPKDVAKHIDRYISDFPQHTDHIYQLAAFGSSLLGEGEAAWNFSKQIQHTKQRIETHVGVLQRLRHKILEHDFTPKDIVSYTLAYLRTLEPTLGAVATEILPAYIQTLGEKQWKQTLVLLESIPIVLAKEKFALVQHITGGKDTPLYRKIVPLLFINPEEQGTQDAAPLLKQEGIEFSVIVALFFDPTFAAKTYYRQLSDCLYTYLNIDIRQYNIKKTFFSFFQEAIQQQQLIPHQEQEVIAHSIEHMKILSSEDEGKQTTEDIIYQRIEKLTNLFLVAASLGPEQQEIFWKEYWQLRDQLYALTYIYTDWSEHAEKLVPIVQWLNTYGKTLDHDSRVMMLESVL